MLTFSLLLWIDFLPARRVLGASDRSVCDRLRLFLFFFLFLSCFLVLCSWPVRFLVFVPLFLSSPLLLSPSLSLSLSLSLFLSFALSLSLPQQAFSHREGLTAYLERM